MCLIVQAALKQTRGRANLGPFNKNLEAVGGDFDPSLFSYTSVKMSSELATSYAALILTDDNVEITVKYRSYPSIALKRDGSPGWAIPSSDGGMASSMRIAA